MPKGLCGTICFICLADFFSKLLFYDLVNGLIRGAGIGVGRSYYKKWQYSGNCLTNGLYGWR